jgi:hypothetical protein
VSIPEERGASDQGSCSCDHQKVFELADGSLSLEQEEGTREHVISCTGCRELYERELRLNTHLGSLDFFEACQRSVCQGVVMALPTRPARARVLWGLLAAALLVAALVTLELNGAEPVMLTMSVLGAGWGFVSGSADVARAVFAAAGSTILLMLALGAVLDVLIALAVVAVTRGRRVREA